MMLLTRLSNTLGLIPIRRHLHALRNAWSAVQSYGASLDSLVDIGPGGMPSNASPGHTMSMLGFLMESMNVMPQQIAPTAIQMK